jgi:hypothetical protein
MNIYLDMVYMSSRTWHNCLFCGKKMLFNKYQNYTSSRIIHAECQKVIRKGFRIMNSNYLSDNDRYDIENNLMNYYHKTNYNTK